MSKIYVIVGPTGTGKTKLSIELAKKYNCEIISADATTVYKEANIGTAKVTDDEKQGIKHYMIDIVDLNTEYTLYDYQIEARKILDKLISDNKNIVIVGGSGLYIKALLYDYELNKTKKSNIDLSNYTNEELKTMCNDISLNDIHVNNRQRLERFINYFNENNKVISKSEKINTPVYDFTLIGLTSNRDSLYFNINNRVDEMFENGLLNEAKTLDAKNYKYLYNIIGYKELKMYFNNQLSLDETKELIKQNSRKYAKRQLTWFNNQFKNINWFDVNYSNFSETINEVFNYINKNQ